MLPIEYSKEIIPRKDLTLGYLYFIDKEHPLASINGKIYHHRHIASLKLGRWITEEEMVHHKDRNKINNHPDNLQILTQKEHAILHHLEAGRNISKEKICPECKKTFTSLKTTYCSVQCVGNRNRNSILKDTTIEQLSTLVWLIPTTEVAKLFKVSDVAIGKRCKKLGILKPPRGYWEKIYHQKTIDK